MNINPKYEKIINLQHHVSSVHAQMPVSDRAAQFSAFRALTGYDDAVKETERLTENRTELDDTTAYILNAKMQILQNAQHMEPEITVTYFMPDERKVGGRYVTVSGKLRRTDESERLLLFTDGTSVPIDSIIDMNGNIFNDFMKTYQ